MTVYWYDWATFCTDTLLRKCLNYTKFSATVCYHHTVSFFSLDVQLYLYWCIVIGSSKELSIDICWVQVAITIENTKIKDHVTNRCTFVVEYTNEPSKLFLNSLNARTKLLRYHYILKKVKKAKVRHLLVSRVLNVTSACPQFKEGIKLFIYLSDCLSDLWKRWCPFNLPDEFSHQRYQQQRC